MSSINKLDLNNVYEYFYLLNVCHAKSIPFIDIDQNYGIFEWE